MALQLIARSGYAIAFFSSNERAIASLSTTHRRIAIAFFSLKYQKSDRFFIYYLIR
ncbi:hypothetical protein [Coleofasciculus sp. H7-2]|uniref:hypothetical protein n=1 Tax=Coleofasciculus sp. H7-2 TaxID=3351545 RepID=UPI00366E3C5D